MFGVDVAYRRGGSEEAVMTVVVTDEADKYEGH